MEFWLPAVITGAVVILVQVLALLQDSSRATNDHRFRFEERLYVERREMFARYLVAHSQFLECVKQDRETWMRQVDRSQFTSRFDVAHSEVANSLVEAYGAIQIVALRLETRLAERSCTDRLWDLAKGTRGGSLGEESSWNEVYNDLGVRRKTLRDEMRIELDTYQQLPRNWVERLMRHASRNMISVSPDR